MKNFFKCFAVYLTAVMVLFGTVLFPAVGASAAESSVLQPQNGWYLISGCGSVCETISGEFYRARDISLCFNYAEFTPDQFPSLGVYCLLGYAGLAARGGGITVDLHELYISSIYSDDLPWGRDAHLSSPDWVYCVFYGPLTSEQYAWWIESAEFWEPDTSSEITDKGLYNEAFDLFVRFIYGEGAELTSEQNMVMTILATIAVLFVVIVPFLVVYFVIRLIFGR